VAVTDFNPKKEKNLPEELVPLTGEYDEEDAQ
jgi:hypothetical protein